MKSEKENMSSATSKVVTTIKSETSCFVIGLLSVIFGVYLLLAFSSFFFTGGDDQSILQHPIPGELIQGTGRIQNYAGARGAQLAQFLMNDCFGISAYCIIVFLIVAGMNLMKAYRFTLWKWFTGCTAIMIWSSVTLGFIFGGTFQNSFLYPGGLHGYNVSRWFCSQLGAPGLALLLLVCAVCIAIFFTRETMHLVRKALHPAIPSGLQPESKTAPEASADDESGQTDTADEPHKSSFPDKLTGHNTLSAPAESFSGKQENIIHTPDQTDAESLETEKEFEDKFDIEHKNPEGNTPEGDETEGADEADLPTNSFPRPEHSPAAPDSLQHTFEENTDEPAFEISAATGEDDREYRGEITQPYNPRLDLEYYKFPGIDLLESYDDEDPTIDFEEQKANKDRIIKVLRSFGIEISSIKASVGPTITLYEITPAEGVRISKIRNLEDDIALSLSALGIRIIAPIPGKGTIGIEVPNARPRIVPMGSILASRKFQESKDELPLALGKTITNEVFMVDLAKAPHMLVAGATGQGKSVGLNAIVTSLLYKKHPSELKFVIIDPKKVEFAIYAPIEKHYLAKLPDADSAIITDVTKVVQTLNSLCQEMDSRYDLLQKAGCRKIKEYNEKFINRQLNPADGHRFMPYIVIIIDEFGDLIMTAGKEVELPICRIAQLARAVGIHAIIATQRPTTNIITGTIKANFPARMAFRVASMMDSRTILDRPGAQQLVGKGDMLYLQGNDPVRVQCAFVDTPEVEQISEYISRQQGYPTAYLLPDVENDAADISGSADADNGARDPLFEEAARLLIYHQQGSTSLIQRKFSIGYNRAGRIMDQLERAGIVGPANGSKAREVLCMDENDLDMRINGDK